MIKKRYFRLCSGPLMGRTLCPGSAEYPLITRDHGGARLSFSIPVARAEETSAAADRPTDPALVHIYEVFDLVDEISLEIVLCKYLGTCPRCAPVANMVAA